MGKLSLILGGARSGKSTYAEQMAHRLAGDQVLYVATLEVKDEEMRQRAENHQASRLQSWRTLEAPRRLSQAISQSIHDEKVILIDCLTLYVSNALLETTMPSDNAFNPPSSNPFDPAIDSRLMAEIEDLLQTHNASGVDTIIVSNEVGLGLVPPYELGRAYRDMLGRVNQVLASQADDVYFLVAGIPMKIK
jgi:adenosylcobinamide kinase/adenosylcobinamide-phosphate guanylyltransferase